METLLSTAISSLSLWLVLSGLLRRRRVISLDSESQEAASSRKGGRRDVVVIKLGGAAITVKDRLETLDDANIRASVKMLSKEFRAGRSLIVTHGAGSFGHFQAKRFKLNQGSNAHPDPRIGLASCRRAVTALNHHLVTKLVEAGVPAVGVSPFPATRAFGGVVAEGSDGGLLALEELIDRGYVPVLHGDVVLDKKQGHCILGGDAIVERVCDLLRRRARQKRDDSTAPRCPRGIRAVFITDVEGVYDRPPTERNSRLLTRIVVDKKTGFVEMPATSTQSHDVTGGIREKIKSAARIAQMGIPVYIVKAASESAQRAVAGCLCVDQKVCTAVVPR
jgi:isopentenyl phosphate kinase